MKEKIKKFKLKKFKFPIDLIEFPIKYSNDLKVLKGKEKLLEFYLEGRYVPYYIDAPRKYKIMDKELQEHAL